MFANGHKLIMDMAVDALGGHPLFTEHYDALLLGNLREDVYKFPFVHRFMMGKGLTHYYRPGSWWGVFPLVPSAPRRSDWLFKSAVRAARNGDMRESMYRLGRVVHLLSEMAAPVHAQVVLHWRGDPFEMYIEHNARTLRSLPLPAAPTTQRTAGALVHDLAAECNQYPCDRTRNLPGYLAWRLGIYTRPDPATVEHQVKSLVPLGAAYTLSLYRLFLAETARA